MDGTIILYGALLGLIFVGVAVVLPIIAFIRARSASKIGKRNEESWQKLTQRMYALEKQIQELQNRLTAQATAAAHGPAEGQRVAAIPVMPSPTMPPSIEASRPAVKAPRPETPEIAPPAAIPAAPNFDATSHPAMPEQVGSLTPAAPPPLEISGGQKPPSRETAKRALNIEELVGANWLNKLGVIGIVIGVAYGLSYEMHAMGPAGKVLVGLAVGAAFLGAGVSFERQERWRIMARAAMGGGWALLYFTTYAMNHIGAARILQSESLDFTLLLLVAAVMVAHTLRYQSRVVTGLAFLLAFCTVNISHAPAASLIATVILVVALVVIVGRRRWYDLEVLAILAVFLNHFFWLRPIIEPMGAHRHAFPELLPSTALLISYWLVFRASYLLRRGLNDVEEKVSTLAALLNTFMLLGVMKYQSVHPEWAFRFLLVLGAIEFLLGQLPIARRRRAAFTVLSLIGAALMVAAIPFKYSGEALPILWLTEAEALFLAGVFLDEIVFCRLGLLASMLVAFQLNVHALGQIDDPEWKGFHGGERLRGILEFAATSLIFYGDAHWLARRTRALVESRFGSVLLRMLSYAAAATAVIGVWWLSPEPWVAVGLSALGLMLAVLGRRTKVKEFLYEAHAAALLAFLRVLAVNFGEPSPRINVRVTTAVLTAVMLYACARWSGLQRTIASKYVCAWPTWGASAVLGVLAWHELRPVSVALAWTLMGLVLFEFGRARGVLHLRLQAYLAFVCSFLRLFFVNFNAAGVPGQLSPRFYTSVPLALAFFYVYAVLDASGKPEAQSEAGGPATQAAPSLERERRWKVPGLLCFLGTFTLVGWARFEVQPDWVVAAWAAMIWALVAIAWRYQKRIFLYEGLLLGAAVLMRGTLHNFYERSYFPAPYWQSRSLTIGVTVALLFATLPFALKLRRLPGTDLARGSRWRRAFDTLGRRPDQVFFFIPFFLLTFLLGLEVSKGMVTVAWGVEAVTIFMFALATGQRSYRLAGLGLLLLCVGKIVVLDVWGLQLPDRIVTFIVLGASLVGVSFLYTRYREAIQQYL